MNKEVTFPTMEVMLLGGAVLPLVVTAVTQNHELGLGVARVELGLLFIALFAIGEKRP